MAALHQPYFSSRWSLLLATLGIAVGTGNIWRFPRIAAQNGGGTFLIPWLIFLFSWSIPLIIVEFAMGRMTRKSPLGSLADLIGPRYLWMGAFIGLCTMAIMFYYSVVMGWCLKYMLASLLENLPEIGQPSYWQHFIASPWQPVFYHLVAMSIGTLIISQGLHKGIERYNRILIPSLFVTLALGALQTARLPGALTGIQFLLMPAWEQIFNHKVWLEALSQSAWSTGAGWGLLLTYAIYMSNREDIIKTALYTGLGDSVASVLAALIVIPTVFAWLPEDRALHVMAEGNTGLTFIWLPGLFAKIPGGRILLILFFISLSFAALSSLIAMIELAVRLLSDLGIPRRKAVICVGVLGFVLGIPSAVNIRFFNNQDWTWGLGLMLSGFFFCFAVIKFGARRFRIQLINLVKGHVHLGRWFDYCILFLIPAEFLTLIIWWFYRSLTSFDQQGWWHPWHTYSIGTCVFQWGLLIISMFFLQGWLYKKIAGVQHTKKLKSPQNESCGAGNSL